MAPFWYVVIGYDELARKFYRASLPRGKICLVDQSRDPVESYHPLYVMLFAQALKSYFESFVLSEAHFK